ncbi:ammonia-dependent NAD(+) synthetase [Desemzia incerta]|uniref:NH(3)-dependent NAD(+) synthetase n=1 Tax=Desemzia incerta TaxID=82801 RepID=A0A1I5XMQ5_9LACT|nr:MULTISPECIES: ammonia-dependent NAD(+) synthetase [Desemzia]MCI3029029.1 ammonia-dependent NAD(+) synthetase [Desemzia sp. C1]WHZ33096.1 ammonia-dependent NAD(+) synthetase [Desemzia incerta]SFQ33255.1 NH(3)-dependent NAD(+) synthetase [Desemzia incerta]
MSELRDEIISEMKVQPSIDPKEEVRKRVEFLKSYLTKYPFIKTFVLGISGGQDSTLAGKISQLAITEMREETNDASYQFIAVRLPYGTQADEQDALDAIEFMEADKTVRFNIQPATDAVVEALTDEDIQISDFNIGNVKARQRMIAQYAIAGNYSGVVVGTDQSAESVTGFYTKYGDGGTDINPLFGLNKRQGRAMLKELGCPEHLYTKVPTADLENDRPSLPDEAALGVTYEAIDDYLEGKEVKEEDAKTIESWFVKTRHKRHMPIDIFDDFWK